MERQIICHNRKFREYGELFQLRNLVYQFLFFFDIDIILELNLCLLKGT